MIYKLTILFHIDCIILLLFAKHIKLMYNLWRMKATEFCVH